MAQPAEASSSKLIEMVEFHLGADAYALELACVREITPGGTVSKVPKAPDYVEGVMNLRGQILPVVNLRRRLGMKEIPADRNTRIVVISNRGRIVGFVVDRVEQIVRVPADRVEPAPVEVVGSLAGYVRGLARLDKRVLVVLNPDELVDRGRLGTPESATGRG